MKKIYVIAAILCGFLPVVWNAGNCYAQNVGINPTGSAPNNSAGLDVDFTNKGILIPRMTTAQRNAIASPATSLMIFNTTTNCLEIYLGGLWQSIYCGCIAAPAAPTANAATGISVTGLT